MFSLICVAILAQACGESGDTASVLPVAEAPRPRWIADVGGPSTALRVAAMTSTVVIVGGHASLAGLEVKSGRKLWTLPVPFILPYSGVAVVDDHLAAVVSGDGFVSFDPSTGRVIARWLSPLPSNFPSQATPQRLSDRRVVFPTFSRRLVALDAASGRLDTLVTLPGDSVRSSVIGAITIRHDTIYAPVKSDSPRGSAFRTTVLYRLAMPDRHLDSLQRDPSDSSSMTRWMLSTDDLLVSATDYGDPSWLAFDRRSGARRWKVAAQTGSLGPSSQAAVVGDTMFAGGNDGQGYVFRLSSGQLLRKFTIPEGLVAGVAACGEDIFVNVIGTLSVLSHTGQSRGAVAGLADGVDVMTGAFVTGNGITVIGGGSGKWYAFDCP